MIAIGLNLILGVLLFCAMIVGARLERRLRTLRDGQVEFAKAVSELDQAAARTEAGLAALRASSENARTELASRIDQARLACQRLEQLTAEADKALSQPLVLSQPIAAAPRPAPAPAAVQPGRHDIMSLSAMARTAAASLRQPAPAAAPPSRGRAAVDDDLFDAGPAPERRPSLAAVMGARR